MNGNQTMLTAIKVFSRTTKLEMWSRQVVALVATGHLGWFNPNIISQHKNCDISEMHEYFHTKFWSFVSDIILPSCYIYFTYVKVTKAQLQRMNFTVEQQVGFIKVTWAVRTTFLWHDYYVIFCLVQNKILINNNAEEVKQAETEAMKHSRSENGFAGYLPDKTICKSIMSFRKWLKACIKIRQLFNIWLMHLFIAYYFSLAS